MVTEKNKRILWALFCLYCAAMLYLLFAREDGAVDIPYLEQVTARINLTPFHTIMRQIRRLGDFDRPWLMRHSFINLFGNVVLFIPMGIFLPRIWKKLRSWWKTLLATAGIIVLVEIGQVLTLLGRGDVDDVILNVIGAAVGYGVYRIMEKGTSPSA